MEKGYLQMSFTWLFAIIVGGFILFLAIYAVINIKPTEDAVQDVVLGKEIGNLLNLLETGYDSTKTTVFELPVETKIYNKCYLDSYFGSQVIQISQKSFNEFTEPSFEVEFFNKYIFSERVIEGEDFYVISKSFEFPFKVANLMIITPKSEEYCFTDAPEEIKEDLERINDKVKSFLIGEENCGEESKKVCFDSFNCDINVYNKVVEKEDESVSFEGDALMYAAIFSEKDIYECQVKRLMQRTAQLAVIYDEKASFIEQRAACNTNLDLIGLSNFASVFVDSDDLSTLAFMAENIQELNDDAICELW